MNKKLKDQRKRIRVLYTNTSQESSTRVDISITFILEMDKQREVRMGKRDEIHWDHFLS